MKKYFKGYFKGYKEEDDAVEFIASSNSVDREGESIDPMGWDLSNIGKNLPLLWSHDARELPIGKVTEAHVEGNNLIASVKFAHEVNDFAKKVYDLVKAGFLNAVSVGFVPKTYDNEGNMTTQELLELSVVNVPANQDALRSNMYQAFCKSLDDLDKKELDPLEATIKSPACLMEGETKEQCVARKIPEIMKEDPSTKQEQAVAMAEGMCEKSCVKMEITEEEKSIEVIEKEGRIISEKNRNTVRIAIEAMSQAGKALGDLLDATEPPAKKGGVKNITPDNKRDRRIYDLARLQDKVGEAIIQELKKGGEIK